MNRLLEERTMNEIISFASDFASHEDEAVDLLFDAIITHHTNRAPIVDRNLVHSTVNRLRAADSTSASSTQQSGESMVVLSDPNVSDFSDDDDEEMWMQLRQLPLNDLSRHEIFPSRASKSAIQALPNVFTTDDFSSSWACAVCMDDKIEANDGAKQLPCKHIFHTHCIVSWLELRNSCPLCRCQLPT